MDLGEDEDDNIASLRLLKRKHSDVRIGNSYAVNEFVDQEIVAHQEGRFHGAGGDLKRLDNKSSDKKKKYDSDNNWL
jgi:hypothetical protein